MLTPDELRQIKEALELGISLANIHAYDDDTLDNAYLRGRDIEQFTEALDLIDRELAKE